MSFYAYKKILAFELFALCRRKTLHCIFELCLKYYLSIVDYLANLYGRNGILLFWVIFLKIRRRSFLWRLICDLQQFIKAGNDILFILRLFLLSYQMPSCKVVFFNMNSFVERVRIKRYCLELLCTFWLRL